MEKLHSSLSKKSFELSGFFFSRAKPSRPPPSCLTNNDACAAELSEKVVVDGSILVERDGEEAQAGLVHSGPNRGGVLAIFARGQGVAKGPVAVTCKSINHYCMQSLRT